MALMIESKDDHLFSLVDYFLLITLLHEINAVHQPISDQCSLEAASGGVL